MKSTKKTVRKRVEEIFSLRLLGALPTDIRRHAEMKKWNVSDRQLQRFTAEADELLAQSLEDNRDRLMAYHFAARRALYARAMAAGDLSTAGRILKDEAELLNLYPTKRAEVTGKNGAPIVLNIHEVVTGREPAAALPVIREEVVTNDHRERGDDTPASGAAGVPAS
jgi:hypothetical protein